MIRFSVVLLMASLLWGCASVRSRDVGRWPSGVADPDSLEIPDLAGDLDLSGSPHAPGQDVIDQLERLNSELNGRLQQAKSERDSAQAKFDVTLLSLNKTFQEEGLKLIPEGEDNDLYRIWVRSRILLVTQQLCEAYSESARGYELARKRDDRNFLSFFSYYWPMTYFRIVTENSPWDEEKCVPQLDDGMRSAFIAGLRSATENKKMPDGWRARAHYYLGRFLTVEDNELKRVTRSQIMSVLAHYKAHLRYRPKSELRDRMWHHLFTLAIFAPSDLGKKIDEFKDGLHKYPLGH